MSGPAPFYAIVVSNGTYHLAYVTTGETPRNTVETHRLYADAENARRLLVSAARIEAERRPVGTVATPGELFGGGK